jgi:hypothetical protein
MTTERELLERIKALENRVEKLERITSNGESEVTFSKKKRASAKEFLNTKLIKSDVQRVLALGYFLEYLEGFETFNVVDLEKAFHAAKEKVPSNINDAVNKNIGHGFVMEAPERKDSKKAWCLTSTGEKFVITELERN